MSAVPAACSPCEAAAEDLLQAEDLDGARRQTLQLRCFASVTARQSPARHQDRRSHSGDFLTGVLICVARLSRRSVTR